MSPNILADSAGPILTCLHARTCLEIGNPWLKTVAINVFRKEIFGILLNVLETSQTLSLLDTVNEMIFLAVIGR